jgi:hypothetical protein
MVSVAETAASSANTVQDRIWKIFQDLFSIAFA